MDPRSSYPPHHQSSRYITQHHHSFPNNPNNNNNICGPHHHHSILLPAPPLPPPPIRPPPPQQQPSPSYHTPTFNPQFTYNPNHPDLPNFLQSQSPHLLNRSRFGDDLPLPPHRFPDYTRDSRDTHPRVLPPDSYHRELDNHNPTVQFMHELDGGNSRFVPEHNLQRQDLYVLGRAADEIYHHRRDAQFGLATSSNRSSRDFRVVSNQNNHNSSTYERGFVYDDRFSGDDNDFFTDAGTDRIVDPDGVRLVSGKREHYRCRDGNVEFERHRSKGSREGSYEFNRTPRKLQQKKSVLLRIQKPYHRYREDEKGHYSGYCGDTKSSSFRGKEHSNLYSDRNMGEQVRERSPVELDVSFKSNSLVAKAIVTPSPCSAGVSDSNLKPRNDKVRKVLVLNKDSSSSPLIKPNEDIVKLDGAVSVANTTSSCDRGLKQSKEEVTASGVDNVYDSSSLPGSSGSKVSLEKSRVESSTEVNASDKEGTDVVSGKTSLLKVAKKKKIVKRVVKKAINPNLSSSSSLPTKKSEEPVIADSFAHSLPATSEPEKDAATASVDNLDSQPCSIETTVMPENNRVGEFAEAFASKNDAAADSGRLRASIIKRKRNRSASPSASSRNEQPKNNETMVHGASANYLPATSDTVKDITKMLNETACTDIDSVQHANKQLHQNKDSLLFENNAPRGSPKALLSIERNANFGFLSPERNNLHEDPSSSCNETLGYESDNGLVNSPEGNNICDIQTTDVGWKQPCTDQDSPSVLNGIVDQFLNASFSGGSSKFLWQSNSGETANQNVTTCVSCSNDGIGTLFSSDNGHTVSGETNFSCHETSDEIHRQPYPDRVSISLESDSVGASLGCMNTRVDCKEDASDIKKCKKNIEMPQLDLSKSEANDLYLEPVNMVNSACWVDTTLRLSFKDLAPTEFTVSDNGCGDVGSQPCTDGVIAFPQRMADVAEVNVSVNNITKDGSNGTSPQNKRKRKLYGAEKELTCSIASDVNEGPITAAFSAPGVEAPSNSHNVLMQPEVEATESAINPLSPSDFPPFQREITASLDNCSGRLYCSTAVSLGDGFEDHGLRGVHSHSAAEELVVPEVRFLCPSGSEGELIVNATPVISGSSHQNTSIVESGTPQCQFPADLMLPGSDERFPSIDVENYCCHHAKKDLPSMSNYLSSEDGNGVSATKLDVDHLEALPDVPSTSYSQLSVEKVGGDNEILDGKPAIQSGYDISSVTPGSPNAEISLSSGGAVEIDHSISGKTVFLPLQGSRNSTQTLTAMSREIYGRKIHSNHVISRIYPDLSSFIFTPKSTGTATHISKPRTWHRTDNSSASAPPGNKVFSGSVPTRSQLPRKNTKFQNTSYIRKGNSLVRKPSHVAGQSQDFRGLTSSMYQLNSSGTNEVKKNAGPDTRTIVIDPPNSVRTGHNASFERPRTPLLLTTSKMPNHTTNSLGDSVSSIVEPVHNSAAETASDPMTSAESHDLLKSSEDVVKIAENTIIQTGNTNNFDFHNENMVSSNANSITYIKRKTNQLVATSNLCSSSVNNINTLYIPSDGYYKRRKNQLIRTSVESYVKQPTASMPDESANSEGEALHSISSSRSLIKRRLRKGAMKTCKPSKFSLVWTLQSSQLSNDDGDSLQCQKVLPYLFPWKRATYWRSFIPISAANTSNSSSSTIRKLLLLRRRDAVYTRSKHGFSLQKSKVLSVGGSSLKWSKSIERRSKKANEEATLAVAEAERKKREQGGASNVVSGTKNRSSSSRKSVYSIKLHPGERIFRIGTVRYKMDPSRRTLQRISDDESNSAALATEKDVKRSYVPFRLMIGKDEYVQIGNGNQLVRDPKKRTRILASEKVRWSLHTARLRLAKKRKYCQFFTRFGKCNKDDGKCPYIHDPSKIAVCTKFLNGLCFKSDCKLTHKVIPERMPDCSYFLQGLCTNKNCPYRHVHVNPSASMCEGFLRGYCADGNECRKKHSYVCPIYGATGSCPQGSKCKLHHPKKRSKGKKSKQSREKKNALGRYFGSMGINISEPGNPVSGKHLVQDDDNTLSEGSIADYISLDKAGENSNRAHEPTSLSDSDPMDLELVDFDELIEPIRIMNT